ncbi:MAG: outer membrane beta-barrel protein, partial [Pseudomonadota bacterium]
TSLYRATCCGFLALGTALSIPAIAWESEIYKGGVVGMPLENDRVSGAFLDARVYLGLRGGFSVVDDTEFDIAAGTVSNAYDSANPAGSAFVGFDMRPYSVLGTRIEIEVGYASNDVESHTLANASLREPTGTTTALTGAINGYIDAHLGPFRPFIGAGIGIALVDFDQHGAAAPGMVMDTGSEAFFWQIAGGLGYQVNPALTIEAMARYQSIKDVELTSTDNIDSEADLDSTQAMVGFRYSF